MPDAGLLALWRGAEAPVAGGLAVRAGAACHGGDPVQHPGGRCHGPAWLPGGGVGRRERGPGPGRALAGGGHPR